MIAKLCNLPPPPEGKTGWPWTEESPPLSETMSDGRHWPKISIVTPSYNQGEFIEETIRSVLLQAYPNLEYFVIDGGSEDASVEIIKKYEPWLNYWESKRDRGQSHAINKGFIRSTGQIMAWINSDDVYGKGVFKLVAQTLAEKDKTILVGASIITDSPHVLSGRLDCRRPTWVEMVYDARTFPQPSVFWTRDLWKVVGPLDEELDFVMDYDLWLRMVPRAREIIFLNDVLSFARSHELQKAKVFERKEPDLFWEKFLKERVYASLRAAKLCGEHPLIWLFKVWERRILSAFHNKKLTLLKGSGFHRRAFHEIFKWRK